MIRMIPNAYLKKLEEWKKYSGIDFDPRVFFKKVSICSLSISLFLFLIFRNPSSFLLSLILFFLLPHGFLILAVERRRRFVEDVLPDVLEITASNLRSGFIPSKALLLSARPEFGPLSEAIKRAGKEMATGVDIEKSIEKIKEVTRSEMVERTINLITEGIRSGGSLAPLLEESAKEIRRRNALQAEIRASMLMYMIFIIFAACIGSPLLYALSMFLITTMSGMTARMKIPADSPLSGIGIMNIFTGGGISVDSGFMMMFSVAAILITSFFSGILISVINTGKSTEGIKYAPIFIAISLTVFFLSNSLISTLFSGFASP